NITVISDRFEIVNCVNSRQTPDLLPVSEKHLIDAYAVLLKEVERCQDNGAEISAIRLRDFPRREEFARRAHAAAHNLAADASGAKSHVRDRRITALLDKIIDLGPHFERRHKFSSSELVSSL